MRYLMAQLMRSKDGDGFDCHFTVRGDDKDAPPLRQKSRRNITPSSIMRFYALSEGKRSAYSCREWRKRERQRA